MINLMTQQEKDDACALEKARVRFLIGLLLAAAVVVALTLI